MILMQDLMDMMYDAKSASGKGTLFHLKNLFNQRSVSKNVSETFNYVSEFLKFVTEGYVVLFAMDILGMEELDDELNANFEEMSEDQTKEYLKSLSLEVVTKVWVPLIYSIEEHSLEKTAYEYCFCKQDLEGEDEAMIRCDNDDCENGSWFHFECIGLEEENLPDNQWFCSEACLQSIKRYKFCVCKTYIKGEPMILCSNSTCREKWFHSKCIGLPEDKFPSDEESWYCSQQCKRADKRTGKQTGQETQTYLKYSYKKSLVRGGINDLIRRDAVRENDGRMMLVYWKADMVQFYKRNHYKYMILGHRLIAGINPWLPERLRQDVFWNRAVNLRGGLGNNLVIDLVNEFLNREFKDSIRSAGSKLTPETLERHGKIAGGVGKHLDQMYKGIVKSDVAIHSRAEVKKEDDLAVFVRILKSEKLVKNIYGRSHKTFKNFSEKELNSIKMATKLKSLSATLNKRRKTVVS